MELKHRSLFSFRAQRARAPEAPPSVTPPTFAAVPWHVDVHSHAARLHHELRALRPPKQAARLRKLHLSACAWKLIRMKSYHFRRCRALRHQLRQELRREALGFWRTQRSRARVRPLLPSSTTPSPLSWVSLLRRTLALHEAQFELLVPQVKQAVIADDREYFTALAFRQGQVGADEGFSGLWKAIKSLLPRQRRKRQSSIRATGPSLTELAGHFDSIEAGESMDYELLLRQCFDRQRNQATELPLVYDLLQLPSRLDLEQVCRKAKPHKAGGIDGATIDDLKRHFGIAGLPLRTLIFKTWLLGAEPLQWKGGQLFPIGKKPGFLSIDNTRGIMLLPAPGKLYHSLLRQAMLPAVESLRAEFQFGGFARQQPAFATILLRSYTNKVAASYNLSQMTVFFDVRHAFHSMLRQHVFAEGEPMSLRLRQCLANAGLDVEALLREAADHAHPFTATASAHVRTARPGSP